MKTTPYQTVHNSHSCLDAARFGLCSRSHIMYNVHARTWDDDSQSVSCNGIINWSTWLLSDVITWSPSFITCKCVTKNLIVQMSSRKGKLSQTDKEVLRSYTNYSDYFRLRFFSWCLFVCFVWFWKYKILMYWMNAINFSITYFRKSMSICYMHTNVTCCMSLDNRNWILGTHSIVLSMPYTVQYTKYDSKWNKQIRNPIGL